MYVYISANIFVLKNILCFIYVMHSQRSFQFPLLYTEMTVAVNTVDRCSTVTALLQTAGELCTVPSLWTAESVYRTYTVDRWSTVYRTCTVDRWSTVYRTYTVDRWSTVYRTCTVDRWITVYRTCTVDRWSTVYRTCTVDRWSTMNRTCTVKTGVL